MRSWNEIRKAATAFSKRWKDAYDEKSQAQSFLKEFFAVFGVDAVTVATFEHRVKFADGSQGYADCFWPGKILVEMKSRGKDLDAAYAQALDYVRSMTGTTGVSPVGNKGGRPSASTGKMPVVPVNAQDARSPSDLPRAIVVSDFARVRFYDLSHDCALTEFALKDLRKFVTLFGYMIGDDGGGAVATQDPVNRRAAEKMARLHDAMKAVGYTGHPLEVYLVRLLFCLFAEDTGIFKPNQFSLFVERKTAVDGNDLAARLAELFDTLNAPPGRRLSILDETVAAFPYVNGGLFAEMLPVAAFSAEMRRALLDCGVLDWSKISPAIFGAMFQGVMDEKARHDLGAHYTSEENILKLIRPLFLNGLHAEFAAICALRGNAKMARLKAFHEKIAALTFLDPACGCGNFLLIAYRELRRLEMDVLEELYKDSPEQFLDISQLCKVSVSQFHGIEIEPFAAEIAKVALWLMDHLCNMEVADRFGQYFARIPIKDTPHIVCANALTMDWGELLAATGGSQLVATEKTDAKNCVPPAFSYIFGNPPFLGASSDGMDAAKKADMLTLFPKNKNLDFVCGWYKKANDLIQGTATRCAFVSTNSITQGEQVAALWKNLNAEIDFAWRTFKWHNEAKGVAAVHCVIIGFHAKGSDKSVASPKSAHLGEAALSPLQTKTIYDSDGTPIPARHINGYLIDGDDVYVESKNVSVDEIAPGMIYGNKPVDGGNLIIEQSALAQFLADEPKARQFIKRLIGAKELLQRLPRWCLWLKDASPAAIMEMPLVKERIRKCRDMRLASRDEGARKLATTPALFRETHNPKTAIVIPCHSSENRLYIPMEFIDDSAIVTNANLFIPNATVYHFGVLMSRMHNAFTRAVCGRLKSDYRYSKDIVYNNFVWPRPSDEMKERITAAAQEVLDIRKRYMDADERCSLAVLYDPTAMPPDLVKAHAHLDALVDKAYGLSPSVTDAERVSHLFALYAAAVNGGKENLES